MASWVDVFLFGPVSEVTQCPVGAFVSVLGVKHESSALYRRLLEALAGGRVC